MVLPKKIMGQGNKPFPLTTETTSFLYRYKQKL